MWSINLLIIIIITIIISIVITIINNMDPKEGMSI